MCVGEYLAYVWIFSWEGVKEAWENDDRMDGEVKYALLGGCELAIYVL